MEWSSEKIRTSGKKEQEVFHVIHKVPSGDGPYVQAKHAQLVEKDLETAIVFNLTELRRPLKRSSPLGVVALNKPKNHFDNVLIDLYKGNLGWAYMQKSNYMAAEVVYKKAQIIYPDSNKACNLALCLMKQARFNEARLALEDVLLGRLPGSGDTKSRNRAEELLSDLESRQPPPLLSELMGLGMDCDFVDGLERWVHEWAPWRSKRLPIFEEISSFKRSVGLLISCNMGHSPSKNELECGPYKHFFESFFGGNFS
ncbi:tetratricopeptide repeat (TPR)-like superfamily protein [Actinidia rufa]|uniref:Tetratricopeptide repeat (TPR)-like superfamily protein n=1 Tax=Actinidia rufa TaxID=165716 RepID=A0A7J0H3P9_9ERIC|nr:tetratricopeptide repeat (TPR)-like superfamily protein [Actinidia rufa]